MTRESGQAGPTAADPAARPAVWLVVVAIVGSAAAYLPGALHPAMLPKHATVLVAAGALVVLVGWRAARGGRPILPAGPVVLTLAVLAGAVVLAALTADVPALAWTGEEERYSGALGYLAAIVVAVAVLAVPVRAPTVLGALLGGGGVVVVTALVHLLVEGPDDLTGSMANPDFLSSYAGMLLPLALVGAGWRWPVWARTASALIVVTVPVVLLGAGTVQGPLTAVTGLAVLGTLWSMAPDRRLGYLAVAVPLLVASAAAATALAGAVGWGPAASLAEVPTFESRTRLWRTAVSMAEADPLTGVGLDRFGAHYHAYRPPSEAAERDLTEAADAAHSVPLHLLATGGAPTALAWLALPLPVAFAVGGRWRDADPCQRRLAAGFLAADAGYLVQSLVSLDVPPLLTAHLVLLAGALVAVGRPPPRHVPAGRATRLAGGTAVLAGAVAIAVAWSALAADLTAGRGARDSEAGTHDVAVARLRAAVALAPWRAVTAMELAEAEAEGGRLERALAAVDLARARDPRELEALVSGARLARELGRHEEAVRRYEEARRVAPRSPQLALEHARALSETGR